MPLVSVASLAGRRVSHFKMMCDAYTRAQDVTPNYASLEFWIDIETALAEIAVLKTRQFDVLISTKGRTFP